MSQATDARELLAAELERRLRALPCRRDPVTVAEPPELLTERRQVRTAERARQRVSGLVLFSVAGLALAAAAQTGGPGRTPHVADWTAVECAAFWAGWAVAIVGAGGSVAVIIRNRATLSKATVAVGLLPWAILAAFAPALATLLR